MKCIFLYNPNSGRGKLPKRLAFIEKKLRTKYETVDFFAARNAVEFEEKVRESAKRYDTIIFSGGDGTFHNVLQGLKGEKVNLGYIPSGTVNDTARSLGIPRSVRGALKVILKGEARSLDCMKINDSHYAMYIAAAGAFTRATYTTSQSSKRLFGALAYAVEAVKNNLKLEVFPLQIQFDEQIYRTNAVLILVMNGRSVAGFPINKKGSMDDGQLEVAVIRQVSKPNFFRKVAALFSLASLFVFGCKIKKKDIVVLSGKKLVIGTGNDVVWDFDGEEGVRGNVTIETLPRQITLFVPKK